MKKTIVKIVIFSLTIILFFGLFSQPFIAAVKATVPNYKNCGCSGKYTDLKLSYLDKVILISQFKKDENFKKAESELTKEGTSLLLFNPYMRKVETNDGRILEEVWYQAKQKNSNDTTLLMGIKEVNSSNTPFIVQIAKAKSIENKSWIVTDKHINTGTEITFSIKDGKISVMDYAPSSTFGCVLCIIACEGACEGACWYLGVVCLIPCIALCSSVCSGPCGGS